MDNQVSTESGKGNGLPNSLPLKQINKQTVVLSINNEVEDDITSLGSKKKPMKKQVGTAEKDDYCKKREKDNMFDVIPCFKTCHSKTWFKIFVFVLVTSLNITDLVSDWLMYDDVARIEQGLVYGPTEDSLRYSLLAFSIVGSLTFTFEVFNLWWEIFRNNPWLDTDLVSAVSIWVEGVPQIIICVLIVACREEAASYFQLVKASVSILDALIRVAVTLIKYCRKGALKDIECARKNKESCYHVVYRVFIMIGLSITLAGAATVFLFTQAERNPDGSINFKLPKSVIEGKYDDQKYFKNVSIYFSHKLADFNNASIEEDEINLIKIAAINDIRNKHIDITVKLTYDNIQARKTKIVVTQTDPERGTKEECFEINRAKKTVQSGAKCASYISGTKSEIIFSFHFVEEMNQGLIFGDITYNVKQKLSGSNKCTNIDFRIEDNIAKRIEDPSVAAMHYFKVKENIDISYPTVAGVFYNSTYLIDIKEVWKTGFGYCESSGSMSPHYDNSLNVPC